MPSRAPGLSSTCTHSAPAAPTRCSQRQDGRSGATPFTCAHVHCAQISPRGAWTGIREKWCGRRGGGRGAGLGGPQRQRVWGAEDPPVLRRPPAAGRGPRLSPSPARPPAHGPPASSSTVTHGGYRTHHRSLTPTPGLGLCCFLQLRPSRLFPPDSRNFQPQLQGVPCPRRLLMGRPAPCPTALGPAFAHSLHPSMRPPSIPRHVTCRCLLCWSSETVPWSHRRERGPAHRQAENRFLWF